MEIKTNAIFNNKFNFFVHSFGAKISSLSITENIDFIKSTLISHRDLYGVCTVITFLLSLNNLDKYAIVQYFSLILDVIFLATFILWILFQTES